MADTSSKRLNDLVALAQSQAQESRKTLLDNMADLFLAPSGRLSERERALMTQIIEKLLFDAEIEIRTALAERLSDSEAAPPELIALLANDEIAVARPILLNSPLLQDAELVEVVKHRSQEHRLAVAMRQGLSSLVADALVDNADTHVIEALISNHDASLSRQAIDYLVEESRRVDRFQEPLLRRPDLPPDLAHRMFWWVSAGLRQAILLRHDIDENLLDDLLETSTQSLLSAERQPLEAEKLADRIAERSTLSERYVIQNIRGGHVGAAIAGLAKLADIDNGTARRILLDPGGEPLAACCKVAGFSRPGFASAYLLSREAHEHGRVTAASALEEILQLYDRLTIKQARGALRFWMRDNNYAAAVTTLAAAANAPLAGVRSKV